jgi:hypothetical protein
MADTKISALAALATPLSTDLLVVVSDPGGTPVTKRSTIAQVLALALAGGGGLTLLEQHTASASFSLDFTTNLAAGTYDDYLLEIRGLRPATVATALWLQVSVDGGATWESSGYQWAMQSINTSGTLGAHTSFAAGAFSLTGSHTVGVSNGASGSVQIFNPADAVQAGKFRSSLAFYGGDGSPYSIAGGLFLPSPTVVNALRLIFDGRNIVSGVARLYGLAK